jgi:multidrug efflux system outer membrane protein
MTEMRTTITRRISPLLAALLVACSSVPELKAPALDMPSAFKESSVPQQAADGTRWKVAQPAEGQARGEWWLAFKDADLALLIREATDANASLAVAAARVKQARALAGIAQADRAPQVGAGVGAQRSRTSGVSRGLADDAAVAPGNVYQAKLSASYELDLFGRVAANLSAANADAAGSEATYKSVLLALQADVAQTYFKLRATDAELATLARTVDLRTQSVKVNQSRYDNGDIGEFDLARARTELSTVKAEAIGLQRQRVQFEHALAVLLGKPAAMFAADVNPLLESALLPAIPAGLPSALLERRPDISAAQRAMIAANARIGVAKTAMYPSLSLTGGLGTESGSGGNLFNWSARSWVLGALLSMPLIDGGRNKANVARSEAVLEEAVASYRQNVLLAFAEVEDNLAGLRILAGQTEQIDAAVVSARRSADLAQKLYSAGRSSYLDLLDAQRNLAAVERNAVQLRGDRAVTTVALIRSLGGAWQ